MAVTTRKKVLCNIVVETGTDSEGNLKTANVSLGNLSNSAWDADKALAIVYALGPCLQNTINNVQEVMTSTISAA